MSREGRVSLDTSGYNWIVKPRPIGGQRLITGMIVTLLVGIVLAYGEAPAIDPSDDEKYLGAPEDVLFWSLEQKVTGFRNYDKIFPTRKIAAGSVPSPLPKRASDLGSLSINFGATSLSIDEYVVRQNVAGLLVIKDGAIVYERYGLGNTEDTRWVSYSIAKSVTSMLVGAAMQDGYIASLDEKITDYLPRLKGSSYDEASIRNVLQMASGVRWNEDYVDPESDINIATWNTLDLQEFLRHKPRDATPGKLFNYNTAETNLAGTMLRAAIGNNLSTYLSEKIWQPYGMEANAYWMLTEPGGGEFGGCCISATLRDYGRLGLFAMGNGRLADGTEVLPEGWMAKSTTPSSAQPGYGYFWWLREHGGYSASGIFGQGIYINPEERIIVAQHSAREAASREEDWQLQFALEAALIEALND